jgi:5-methylcytosine-specific restriction endonuclease McrA
MLQAHVLVLNRLYQPVSVTNVKRAMCLLYIGAARALDKDYRLFDFSSWAALAAELDDDTLGLINRRVRIPRVLVLQVYEHIPLGRIRFSRQNIFLRDEHTCQYCYKRLPRRGLNLDHVIPRSQGGKTNWENVVASCIGCNLRKGGHTPAQMGMHLARKPQKPTWAQLLHPPRVRARYREWLPFLNPVDAAYWNVELESD